MKPSLLTLVLLSSSTFGQVVYEVIPLPNRVEPNIRGYCNQACWDAKRAPRPNIRIALVPKPVELTPIQDNQPVSIEQQKKLVELTR
jgi:hypothetical protein